MKSIILFLVVILSTQLFSEEARQIEVLRPYAEYQNVGYVLFHHDDRYDQETNLKTQVLKSLPYEVDAVFIVDRATESKKAALIDKYDDVISADRIKIVETPRSGSGMRWNRDHAPIPVHYKDANGVEKVGLVDHSYYHHTELDTYISNFFGLDIVAINGKNFEGGNFLADQDGRCFVMKNRRIRMTDSDFITMYGCAKIVWMPDRGFVGHVDERMKLINDNQAVTDDLEYKTILENEGYEVYLLPKARGYRTYANSLMINEVVVLPIFGTDQDEAAIQVYQDLGLEVHPVRGEKMSDYLKGNVHCISMLYPELQ